MPQLIGAGTPTVGSATVVVPALIAGCNPGDLVLMFAAGNGLSPPTLVPADATWKLFASAGSGTGTNRLTGSAWWTLYSGTDPDTTINVTGANANASGFTMGYRRARLAQVAIVCTPGGNLAATAASWSGLFPPSPAVYLLAWVANGTPTMGTITGTTPAVTEQLDSSGMGYADAIALPRTATGTASATLSSAAAMTGISMIIEPSNTPPVVVQGRSSLAQRLG